MLLRNKYAAITGGAKGMGRSIAMRFAQEGCTTAIIDIDLDEMEKVLSELKRTDQKSMGLRCDVTNEEQVSSTIMKISEQFGRIDILVNNAGGLTENPPIDSMKAEEWDSALDLNLKSIFLFCKYVVPLMQQNKYGKIVNISSIGAIVPPTHSINYNTAKAGIVGFTYDLASHLAPMNITVNAILPGPIRTSFYDKMTAGMRAVELDDFFIEIGKAIPMQRVGEPEEIAGAALFLSSDLSSYVTGETLKVSGGVPLRPPQI